MAKSIPTKPVQIPFTPSNTTYPKPIPVSTVTTKPSPLSVSTAPPTLTPPSSTTSPSTTTTPSSTTSGSTTSGSSTTPLTNPDYTSTNWSGYLSTSYKFSAISANWDVPQVTGNGTTTTADATWIGIGGVTSSDLIQIGTQDNVSSQGAVVTSGFYEVLPAPSQQIISMNISPGDSITASVVETSTNTWVLSMTDNTNNQTFTTTLTYKSSNSSAEWIEEDPSNLKGQLIPLDNFSTINFINALVVENNQTLNLQSSNSMSVAMVNSNDQFIASPSAYNSTGQSFGVTREYPTP